MTRLSRGEDGAYARVFELAWEPVVRSIAAITRDDSLAEDIAQDALLKLWDVRDSYCPGLPVLPWVRTIARRKLIDALRRSQLEREMLRRTAREDGSQGPLADEIVDAKRAADAARRAISRLPRSQADALTLVVGEGVKIVDVAKRLGDTPLAVRLRIHRARAALRKRLTPYRSYAAAAGA